MIARLQAVFPPMATPFSSGDVDVAAIRRNVQKWMLAGVGGVVALGSNGEAPLLDDDGVGSRHCRGPRGGAARPGPDRRNGTRVDAGHDSASKRAARLGADAVLVRTPSYFKSRMTRDAFVRHYTAVADASPVPVLLYNYPAVTGVNLTADAVGRLAAHPNIIGVKETGSDTAQFGAFVAARVGAFAVLAGSAPTFYPSLCMGARGRHSGGRVRGAGRLRRAARALPRGPAR